MAEGAAQPPDGDLLCPDANGEKGGRGGSRGPPKTPPEHHETTADEPKERRGNQKSWTSMAREFVYLRPRQYTDDQGSPRHRLSICGCERVTSQIRIFRLQLDVTLLHECIDV